MALRALKRVPGLKSAYYLSIVIRQMVTDQWRDADSFNDIFLATPDPWQSASSTSEKERFRITLSLLASCAVQRFATAAELGCAEGIFTERLTSHCARLLALDYSPVALERARQRLGNDESVSFRQWDMRHQALEGDFDLIVAMGILTSLYRPGDVRDICDMIVGSLKPHGYLLFSDVRQSRVFEGAWWGRFVLRGGEQIRRLLSHDHRLELISDANTDSHVFALYRRVR
ncbi:MAG: SAM-dependent methyltransferase [Gemmatimonadaceae bacterium]